MCEAAVEHTAQLFLCVTTDSLEKPLERHPIERGVPFPPFFFFYSSKLAAGSGHSPLPRNSQWHPISYGHLLPTGLQIQKFTTCCPTSVCTTARIEHAKSDWLNNARLWCPDAHLIYVPLSILPARTSLFSSSPPLFSLMLDNHNEPQGNLVLIFVLYVIRSPRALMHKDDFGLIKTRTARH